MKGLKDLVRF